MKRPLTAQIYLTIVLKTSMGVDICEKKGGARTCHLSVTQADVLKSKDNEIRSYYEYSTFVFMYRYVVHRHIF